MASKKYIANWDFETEQEGKVKIGQELTLSDERARELREKRLVVDKATWDKRNPKEEKKAPVKDKAQV